MKNKRTKPEVIHIVQPTPVPAAPTVSVAASISGDDAPGATLTGSATFTGTGNVITYSWRKNGTPDGTSSTYSNTSGGESMVIRITATNAGGSVYSESVPFVVAANVGFPITYAARDESNNETEFRFQARPAGSDDEWTTYGILAAITSTETDYNSGTGTSFSSLVYGHPFNTALEARTVSYNGSGILTPLDAPIPVNTAPEFGVSGVTLDSITSTGAVLSATPGTVPLTGYHGYFKATGATVWTLGGTSPTLPVPVTGLTGSTGYQFDIAAYNSNTGFADAETELSGTPASGTTDAPALGHSAQRVAYGASYAWRGNASTPSILGAVIGGIDATTNGSPFNIQGIESMVSGETASAVYFSGSTGNCKIVASGLTLTLPVTIELFTNCSTGGCLFALNTSGSTPHFYLYTTALGGTGLTDLTFTDIANSTRHHVFAVLANNRQEIWVDGVMVGSSAVSLSASPTLISMGAWYGNSGEIVGLLDEPAIYPSALSEAQMNILRAASTV